MSNSDKRFMGWVAVVVGIFIGFKPLTTALRFMTMSSGAPFAHRFRGLMFQMPGSHKIRLFLMFALLLYGIASIVSNRENPEFWQKSSPARVPSIRKKIDQMNDTNKLRIIMSQAPQQAVKDAAKARRKYLMQELLDSGRDQAAIRREVSEIVSSAQYWGIDEQKADFLAQAAKKYPHIVQEFWPKLQEWAHTDSNKHTDVKPGFHTDRTTYYDYTRYPNGRTVANVNGRRRHTDTRSGYSDCHNDRHQDANTHTDNTDNGKIARFRPYTGEKK